VARESAFAPFKSRSLISTRASRTRAREPCQARLTT
jgi:hypothetical protein